MKKLNLLATFLVVLKFASAQQKIDELVNAEKNFATLSKEQTTKTAFVTFLDSNSVVFRNGAIMNGLNTWTNRKEDNSLLLWQPEFAVLSSSGNFGVTTGPSEYKPRRTKDAESYFGHFASLWHKNNNGDWKVLCDIGTSHDSAHRVVNNVTTISLQQIIMGNRAAKDSFPFSQEQHLFNAFKQNEKANLKQMIDDNAWILLAGKHPFHGNDLQTLDFKSSFTGIEFANAGHWTSDANDMYVFYGKTTNKGKAGNYMSCWIFKDLRWKLILLAVN